MNFELISPVGADVDPMPMTRPDRDKCLNTDTATTRPPSVASSLHNPSRQSRDYNTLTIFSISKIFSSQGRARTVFLVLRNPSLFFSLSLFSFFLYLLDRRLCSLSAPLISEQRSTFTATYATQHIITITIPNAAGCGR